MTHCIHFLLFILLSTLFSKINNPKETFFSKMSNVISISNNPKALNETLFSEGQGLRLQPEAKVNFGSVYTECIRKPYLYMKSCKRVFKQNESDRGIISYILHRSCINCNPQEYHIHTRIFMGRRCCFRTPFHRNSNFT